MTNVQVKTRQIDHYARYRGELEAEALENHRRLLFEKHGGLLKKVARRMLRRLPSGVESLEEEDLISAGVIGLFEADARFDPDAGHPFETFAEFRIKGAMLDVLRRRDFFPRRLRLKANKLKKQTEALRTQLRREPTDEELAQAMELEVPALRKLKDSVAPYVYVDVDTSAPFLEDDKMGPFELVASKQAQTRLAEAIKLLPEREAFVLDMYFTKELNLREIAEILGLTVGRISQIKSGAIKRLRMLLQD